MSVHGLQGEADLLRTIYVLRVEIEERDETIRQLREASAPLVAMPERLGLKRNETRLLGGLLKVAPNILSRDRFMLAMYGADAHEISSNMMEVMVCRLRRKLAPFRVFIETHRSDGYAMPADSAARLRTLIAAEAARAAA